MPPPEAETTPAITSQEFHIHFGISKRSKFYPHALELASLAARHEVRGEGTDVWHIVSFSGEQIDLMHRLYLLARKLPRPKLHGVEPIRLYLACKKSDGRQGWSPASNQSARIKQCLQEIEHSTGKSGAELSKFIRDTYVNGISRDMLAVQQKLKAEGCLDGFDYETMKAIPATKPLSTEPVAYIKHIHELIAAGAGTAAVTAYYESLGSKFYGELTSELIYLKRLSRIPLAGRDLLFFRSESSCDEFLKQNLAEYVECIDIALTRCRDSGQEQPLDIILKHAPTMEQMIEARRHDWHFGAFLLDGEVKRDFTPVNFSAQYDSCPEGRLFDRYPDQIRHCRVEKSIEDSEYTGLWTNYSPAFCDDHVYACGLHINMIEGYFPKSWRRRFRGPRKPEFAAITSLNEIEKSSFGTNGIRFTGRQHTIEGKVFYEIDLIRHRTITSSEVENPFVELVEEVLREAENLLRERHGLPRIGEGWVSEMRMFRLIQKKFPDAELHSQPDWLNPQHLDCYVPSIKVGFEYQGQQHFENVAVFGGEEGLARTRQRDQLKAKKCGDNGITLICWIHNETLSMEILLAKLTACGITIPS